MTRFKWTEWSLEKVAAHGILPDEIEYAFDRRIGPHQERADGYCETIGTIPSGRAILIVWRPDRVYDALEAVAVGEGVFVITAY